MSDLVAVCAHDWGRHGSGIRCSRCGMEEFVTKTCPQCHGVGHLGPHDRTARDPYPEGRSCPNCGGVGIIGAMFPAVGE